MLSAQLTRSRITLKGSTKIIVEFFEYAINSILFQRGVYPADDFRVTKAYGTNVLMTTDDNLVTYIKKVCTQLEAWMMAGKISKLVLVIKTRDTREPVERWQFDIQREQSAEDEERKGQGLKSEKEIQAEIGQLMRQITSCVTFLPSAKSDCTFNVLVYADKDVEVGTDWADADPHVLRNSQQVKLRSFSTTVHKVEGMVAYVPEEE